MITMRLPGGFFGHSWRGIDKEQWVCYDQEDTVKQCKMQVQKNEWITPELVALDLQPSSAREAIAVLSNLLYHQGAVKSSFGEAVWAREEKYPTGLLFDAMGIALPHTDAIHVCHQAMAIGILKNPVPFHRMGLPEETVEVSMIFMLAVDQPEKEAAFLATLIELFQKKENLETLYRGKTGEEVCRMFQNMLVRN